MPLLDQHWHCHLCIQYCSHDCHSHIIVIFLLIIIIRIHPLLSYMCVCVRVMNCIHTSCSKREQRTLNFNHQCHLQTTITNLMPSYIIAFVVTTVYFQDPHAKFALSWQSWSIIFCLTIIWFFIRVITIIHHQHHQQHRCLQGKVLETAEEGAKSDRGSAPNPSAQSGQSRGPRFATNQGDHGGPKRGASLANWRGLLHVVHWLWWSYRITTSIWLWFCYVSWCPFQTSHSISNQILLVAICALCFGLIPEEENIAALLMQMRRNNSPCWKLEVVQVVEALRYWMALRAKASRTRRRGESLREMEKKQICGRAAVQVMGVFEVERAKQRIQN